MPAHKPSLRRARRRSLRIAFSLFPPCAILAFEDVDAFDVRGMREHVDHPGRHEAKAPGVDENAGVARERGRVAGDIDDAARPGVRQGFAELGAAFPRW